MFRGGLLHVFRNLKDSRKRNLEAEKILHQLMKTRLGFLPRLCVPEMAPPQRVWAGGSVLTSGH